MALEEEVRVVDLLIAEGHVPPADRPGLVAALSRAPDLEAWSALVHRGGLATGTASALAGVLYLVAFNWEALGFVPKLLAALALPAAAGVGAAWVGPRSLLGTLCSVAGAVTVGAGLVVYSQHWQSGADPWQLFAAWAVLAAPFVLASRSPAAWAVALTLVDLTIAVAVRELSEPVLAGLLTAAALVHLALARLFADTWLDHVLRLVAVGTLGSLAIAFVWAREPELLPAWLLIGLGGLGIQAPYAVGRVGGAAAALGYTAVVAVAFTELFKLLADARVDLAFGLVTAGFALFAATLVGFGWLSGVPRARARLERGDA